MPMSFGAYVTGVTMLSVIPPLFLYARCSAKQMKRQPWAIDDAFLMLSLIFMYVFLTGLIVSVAEGHVGRPMSTASAHHLHIALLVFWLFRIPMSLSMLATRCAISIFFIRTLYTKVFPRLRRIAYCCIYLAISLCFTTIVGILLHCRPVKWNWTPPFEQSGCCFSLKPFVITIAAVGIAIDCITWLLPHWVVWKLQLRRVHKVAITAIFAFGTMNVIMGGLRLNNLDGVVYEDDVTYGIGATLMWALAHMSTSIVVACCPHLRPVFEKIVPRRLTRITMGKPQHLPRPSSITVTTRIDVHSGSYEIPEPAAFHDGHQEPWAPTYEIKQGPAADIQDTMLYCGRLPRGFCCV